MSLLAVHAVEVAYPSGAERVRALAGVDLEVHDHESLALIGRSGSGKTTLLHVLSGLVEPTTGTVEHHATTSLVFQGANLLPHFTARENVLFAQRESTNSAQRDGADAEQLLALVGLKDKLDHLPRELSGGEAQRAAIARSLAQRPDVLLCDEPTGHLDSDTSARVLDLIDALREQLGFALVIATHDPGVAQRCERIVELHDGRIVKETSTR
ncbi:MAG TPA: ABC transporter ATP-binding protein [Gaiellaceae bacterium]|jgi:putative ABC transport system ATP-binding protein|nr:ABC transporter ATP-binding protein [Gaiellaceae bacterium]